MEIVYLGHSSFRLSSAGKSAKVNVVTDPFDPAMVGLKFSKVEADIVTVSHSHPDHNKSDQIVGVRKVIDGPGEYEIGGVSFIGVSSFHDGEKGAARGKNTIYVIEMDGLRVAHLGDLGHELTESQLAEMGDIDVLLIPVGGEYTINSEQAAAITKSIEPNIVIPMHYKVPGMLESFNNLEGVEAFVSKMGWASETLPKLIIKEGLQLEEDQKIVILEKK